MKTKLDYLQTPFKTISFAISQNKGKFFLMCVLITMGNAVAALLPYFFKRIADQVTQGAGVVPFRDLIGSFGLVAAVLMTQEILFRTGHVIETYIAPDAFKRITTSLYEGLIKRPTSYFEDKFSGDLGRRIEQVGTGTVYFLDAFSGKFLDVRERVSFLARAVYSGRFCCCGNHSLADRGHLEFRRYHTSCIKRIRAAFRRDHSLAGKTRAANRRGFGCRREQHILPHVSGCFLPVSGYRPPRV